MRRNRRQQKRENKSNGAPKWMVTYSDMVTLILVFFVLLFSMSNIDSSKFDAVTESFQNRMIFDFYPSSVPIEGGGGDSIGEDGGDKSKDEEEAKKDEDSDKKIDEEKLNEVLEKEDALNRLMGKVATYLEEEGLTDDVSATRTERGVELVLQDHILFDSGEAEILTSGEELLTIIGELLDEIPNYVRVEGHTDNRPISSYRYPSNWELSGARASSVIRYLIEESDLEEQRFSSVGYGETRPIAENNNEKNWQKNRRVEIVILDDAMQQDIEN